MSDNQGQSNGIMGRALYLHKIAQVRSPESHQFPQFLAEVSPEHRARNKSPSQLGMVQKHFLKIQSINKGDAKMEFSKQIQVSLDEHTIFSKLHPLPGSRILSSPKDQNKIANDLQVL